MSWRVFRHGISNYLREGKAVMRKPHALFILLPLISLLYSSNVDRDQIVEWQKGIVYVNYHSKAVASGFFISGDGIIATPFHLIQEWVIFVDGFHIFVVTHEKDAPHKAEIVGFNQKADILFLKIDYKPRMWFGEFEQAKNGQRCVALGFPYGWRTAIEAKIITHFREEWLGIDRIPQRGASGSLILSEKGKVLGMLTKRFGLSFIVPGILIKNGLIKIRKEE